MTRLRAQGRIEEAIEETGNWKEADQAVQHILDQMSSASAANRRTRAATLMLREHLLIGETKVSAQRAAAIGRYTDLLVERKSPEVVIISSALARLQGHWSKNRIRRAARATLNVVKRRQKNLPNAKETYEEMGIVSSLSEAEREQVNVALEKQKGAVRQLKRLSQ